MKIPSWFFFYIFQCRIQLIFMAKESIHIYDAENSRSVQVYDCFIVESVLYCRRPLHPHSLKRDDNLPHCHHQGNPFSFDVLASMNITVHHVLHHFKSTLDRAEDYAHYLEYPQYNTEQKQYLCNCTHPQSFGRNCEYLLPDGNTLKETVLAKMSNHNSSDKLMLVGDIVCYRTLECDYGQLCLDWRDICDGQQQCMYGYDEENCDKLEFNECEDDEYRCRNGMCIPQEYFLDGTMDCMDRSDEKDAFYNQHGCPINLISLDCDDYVCSPHQWSCGDGQCISQRIPFLGIQEKHVGCMNRRDQYFWCEEMVGETLQTLPNGRCTAENITAKQGDYAHCAQLLMCHFMDTNLPECSCRMVNNNCLSQFKELCSDRDLSDFSRYGILAPYLGYRFQWGSNDELEWLVVFNGSIKCRGYIRTVFDEVIDISNFYSFETTYFPARDIFICYFGYHDHATTATGYDEFCYNASRTFNNRSYAFIDVCEESRECLSAYRIGDGVFDCRDEADESQSNEVIAKSCETVRRHRFQCAPNRVTCFYANAIGNLSKECEEDTDEYWNDMKLSLATLHCSKESSEHCDLLRRYIAASSNATLYNATLMKDLSERKIAFRSYCDTFMDLYLNKDELSDQCREYWQCAADEWQCYSGHCIDRNWVLDDEWDCPDASDEENMFAYPYNRTLRNYQSFETSNYTNRFLSSYENKSIWHVCPLMETNTSSLLQNRSCIDLEEDYTNSSFCVDVHDRDIALHTCIRLLLSLGFQFRYFLMSRCLAPSSLLLSNCGNGILSTVEKSCLNCSESSSHHLNSRFFCWDDRQKHCIRCDGEMNCRDSEDEYMCDGKYSISTVNREQKQAKRMGTNKVVQIARYPLIKWNQLDPLDSIVRKSRSTQRSDDVSMIHRWCNRGIGILSVNGTITCFCSSHYHGDQCQYHSDRLVFRYHVDFTTIDETRTNNYELIIKLLIIFLFNDQVISTDEVHFRPKTEIDEKRRSKKTTYFHYSLLPAYFRHKQQRFFDRMNITDHHPYSIRIEAFDMYLDIKPKRFAVWHFPIYFDFLPVFRLAKILRFNTRKAFPISPCSTRPCAGNAECYVLENEPTRYVCICREGYFGRRCENRSELCEQNFCSSKSLCQPNFRGLIHGKDWPYCVCSLNQIGQRCFLYPNACIDNPCENGGSCYQRSQPHSSQCQCTDKYRGLTCRDRRPSIMIDISVDETPMNDVEAIMLQYFTIANKSLDLQLQSEDLFQTMPSKLEYFYDNGKGPDIILAKLYSLIGEQIHLISFQFKEYRNVSASITMENACHHIKSFTGRDLSVYQYHSLCQKFQNLSCFYDDIYLCLCEQNRQRVECFNYDSTTQQCGKCLAGGRCVQSRRTQVSLCICPPCHGGHRCQFNFESFAFTLDQLFYSDLLSNNQRLKSFAFYSLLLIPWLLFFLGLANNLCSFLTFRQKRSLQNGIGQYLYHISLFNQINLTFLLIRLTHLAINIASPYSYPQFDNVFCKLSNYFLVSSTRMIYWLSSLIAIERLYVVLFLQGKWLKKPQTARRFLFILVLTIFLCTSYELYLVRSEITSEDAWNSICTMNFPTDTSAWRLLHTAITIIDSLVPFSINLISTVVIICTVTKKKFNANTHHHSPRDPTTPTPTIEVQQTMKILFTLPIQVTQIHLNVEPKRSEIPARHETKQTRFQLLKDVLIENKELVFAPSMTLIPQLFALPFFIASFTLTCQNLHQNRLRYLLIVSFFTQFIPQLTSFYLYISPSSFYQRQWQKTSLARWIRAHHSPTSFFSRSTQIDDKTQS